MKSFHTPNSTRTLIVIILILVLVVFAADLFVAAFVTGRFSTPTDILDKVNHADRLQLRRESLSRLHNDLNSFLGDDDGAFDVDLARKQLQSLFGKTETEQNSSSLMSNAKSRTEDFDIRKYMARASNDWRKKRGTIKAGLPIPFEDDELPPLPPLSTIERDRRKAEIQLLQQLQDPSLGDNAMKGLWELWYSKRGGMALGRLNQADQLMGDPTSWQDCETSLLQLIDEYGIYFVEPINRLATLYYLQGKYDESYQLCRLILLKLKPWHVGALAGMVQNCINRGDREEARYWASKRLPSSVAGSSFPPSLDESNGPKKSRRVEWVEEMVAAAQDMLKRGEQCTKKQFGEPEMYYTKAKDKSLEPTRLDDDIDREAWQ